MRMLLWRQISPRRRFFLIGGWPVEFPRDKASGTFHPRAAQSSNRCANAAMSLASHSSFQAANHARVSEMSDYKPAHGIRVASPRAASAAPWRSNKVFIIHFATSFGFSFFPLTLIPA